MLESELILLQQKLNEYELIHSQIKQLEELIEEKLLETDEGFLLSIPGIGPTTAVEMSAEIGNVQWNSNMDISLKCTLYLGGLN
ncbi:transposase [Paenisporosarcina quisquiliarum]|uniref:transposase n=1 Tax=Paenisporosarcina quisquiliarum TaxID=365346 RepID=UPI003735C036